MAKVLLADDEEALRLMMGRQLRRAGYEVTLAEDGLAAAALLEADRFDVVVSDMKMPRLDGMGLLARARELAPGVEFIILTGHGSMENAVEAFKSGNVFDYLLKPLEDIRELDAVVARAVERRHLRLENARLVCELEQRIDELEVAKRDLTHLAAHDSLTSLFNHRSIHAWLEETLQAHPGEPLAVMLLDMDGFKQFNDTYGHLVGDQVLRHIADALCEVCRDQGESAHAGRCGGDEFMVVLPGATAQAAGRAAEQMRQRLGERPFRNPEGTALPIQLCFGIADTAGAGRSLVSLVAAADAALYEGKQSGGDAVMLHLAASDSADGSLRATFGMMRGFSRPHLQTASGLRHSYRLRSA